MRHDQRPGGQRHQLPREQKGEGVVGDRDQRHAREEGRIECKHPLRLMLIAPIAEGEQAGARPAETHQNQEKTGQRIEAQMSADPWQTERQQQMLHGGGEGVEAVPGQPGSQDKAAAIGQDAAGRDARHCCADERETQQGEDDQGGVGHTVNRTPAHR